MNHPRPWLESFPPALRDWHLDESALPPSLAELATQGRAQHGSKTAFTLELPGGPNGLSAALDYAAINRHAEAFSRYLAQAVGLRPGEVAAVQLPNSLHYPITAFGTWKAGGVLTNVNPLYTARELRDQLADSGARVLVVHAGALGVAVPVAQELGVRIIVAGLWEFFPAPLAEAIRSKMLGDAGVDAAALQAFTSFEAALAEGSAMAPVPVVTHEVALYQYTGGTTGRSKGAVLTHRNIAAVLDMTEALTSAYGADFRASDVVLTALPMYHVFAFVINFLAFFRRGAHNVLVPNPRPLTHLQPAFGKHAITWMTGVDTLYAGLLAEPWFAARPPALRFAISGGTTLRPTTGARWRDIVGPMMEGYGMTETSCIVAANPPGAACPAGSVGFPMPGCDVMVVDAVGQPVPVGERGELWVRGPHVTSGYLNRLAENAAAITEGWLHTGDVVTLDARGAITIVDRVKDLVLVSGFNVYPNEVEDIIAAHPGVAEVAVIGEPDEASGEAVCACIVARQEGLTAEDVIAHCRRSLTAYKVPKRVRFLAQLPKSPVGKILRNQLRGLRDIGVMP